MKTVRVCFLWHMHQPLYVDRVAGTASMPWVRLHAIKAYYDMAVMMERFPAVRATFNFTPSLLAQLVDVAAGLGRDFFLDHAEKPAADLTAAERVFVLRHFFAANWDTMVRPSPRYHDLLLKRGTDLRGQDLERIARQFSVQELLDLQVWHNLAWFGYGAEARHPRLAELRLQDRGFTEEDKREVLALQREVVREVIPLYRRLAEAGRIELTTTPFYHPILPLLIDTDSARRAHPDFPVPRRFQAPEDAEAQVRLAVEFHGRVFGRAPAGLWPSEGSVCPEMLPMLHRAGLRWLATDEGVLARSLELSHRPWHRAEALYRPYEVGEPVSPLSILFRDRDISDAFGFVYARTPPAAAAADVLHRIEQAARNAPGDQVLVPIILDGENPWEHYQGGGEPFLTGLYGRLAESRSALPGLEIRTETVGRALDEHGLAERLEHLHSGSWINADFGVWAGHPEDHRAWDLVRETRARLVEAAPGLPPEQARGAWDELYAAEGSDWFWWYGDEFQTDFKEEFDRLFRAHLRNVFLRAGLPAPDFLDEPVIGRPAAEAARPPVALLAPTIDGLVTDFFEWHGAGSIDPAAPLGAMWRAQQRFLRILFGLDLERLYLRLDPDPERPKGPDTAVEVLIGAAGARHRLVFPLGPPGPEAFVLRTAAAGGEPVEAGRFDTIRRRKVIELAVPFRALGLAAGQEFTLSLLVTEEGLEVERHPRHQPVTLRVPDRDFDSIMWRV